MKGEPEGRQKKDERFVCNKGYGNGKKGRGQELKGRRSLDI